MRKKLIIHISFLVGKQYIFIGAFKILFEKEFQIRRILKKKLSSINFTYSVYSGRKLFVNSQGVVEDPEHIVNIVVPKNILKKAINRDFFIQKMEFLLELKFKDINLRNVKGNFKLSLQNIGTNTLILSTKLKIKQKYYYNMIGNH